MKIAESLNIKFLKQYFLYSSTLLQQNFSIQLHLSFILSKNSRKYKEKFHHLLTSFPLVIINKKNKISSVNRLRKKIVDNEESFIVTYNSFQETKKRLSSSTRRKKKFYVCLCTCLQINQIDFLQSVDFIAELLMTLCEEE